MLFRSPSNGIVNLTFDLANDNDVSVTIVDITGKTVYEYKPTYTTSGSHTIEINTELPKGVYTSIISSGSHKVAKKLIIL